MALKPTIYKLTISLSDLNKNYYDTLNLTLAQHPSETLERMMVRVLAFCLNAQAELLFTKGLSAVEEPDIWLKSLDARLLLWIDVGEPAVDRVKKARRLAERVSVYCFNTKSDVWWNQGQEKLSQLDVSVTRFGWAGVKAMAGLVERTMNLSMTITENSAYIAAESGECEVTWENLQEQA